MARRHRFKFATFVVLILFSSSFACTVQDESTPTVEPSRTPTEPVSTDASDWEPSSTFEPRFNRTEPVFDGDPYLSPNPAMRTDYNIGSSGYIFMGAYDDGHPAWSPDGQWLAFFSSRDGDVDIYVIQLDGSGLRNLTPDPSPVLASLLFTLEKRWDVWPHWDPSGNWIYFASSRTNIMMAKPTTDIYRVNADGSQIVQLTDTIEAEAYPRISPDGSQILFVSDRDEEIGIFGMNADGTEVLHLASRGESIANLDWSPDGDRILFWAYEEIYNIYLMDADGTHIQQLTDNSAEDRWPVWSPDGSQIAFMSNRDGDYEIYVMNVDGSEARQLTDNGIVDGEPAWSPDGTLIAYRSSTLEGDRIFTIRVEDGQINQITGGPITHPPEENAVYHLHRGLALFAQARIESGDFDSAIGAFDMAIAMDPSLGEAYLGRGMATLMRCEIYWMHVAGPVINITEDNAMCSARLAAISDLEQALELGLAPALIPGVELLFTLLY